MGAPNPPLEEEPKTEPPAWRAFRSTCTPEGCTATSTALDDTNHQIAATPPGGGQWRFTDGRWQRLPEKFRETRQMCMVDENKTVAGDETVLGTTSLEPQPDGSLRGLQTVTVISSECGEEGLVRQFPFTVTRVGDVPSGVSVADPLTVNAPDAPVAPVAGPVLDGTYRLDYDYLATTYNDSRMRNTSSSNGTDWWVFRSVCTASGCAATGALLDDANHQEASGNAKVLNFDGHQWLDTPLTLRVDVAFTKGDAMVKLTCGPEQTVTTALKLIPQPDGTLKGIATMTYGSNEWSPGRCDNDSDHRHSDGSGATQCRLGRSCAVCVAIRSIWFNNNPGSVAYRQWHLQRRHHVPVLMPVTHIQFERQGSA